MGAGGCGGAVSTGGAAGFGSDAETEGGGGTLPSEDSACAPGGGGAASPPESCARVDGAHSQLVTSSETTGSEILTRKT